MYKKKCGQEEVQYIVDPFGNPGADIIGQVDEILSLQFRFLWEGTKEHISYTLLYGNCLLMSRTKTNWRTDRQQYTRSNAATAKLLTLVKPAET